MDGQASGVPSSDYEYQGCAVFIDEFMDGGVEWTTFGLFGSHPGAPSQPSLDYARRDPNYYDMQDDPC